MAVIGICGSYGGLNMGDEAILAAMLSSLRVTRDGDEIVVFSRDAAHTEQHHDVDRAVETRRAGRDELCPQLQRLDLFLLGGGGILYDTEARVYLSAVRLAQELDVPTFCFAVGAGPLEDPDDRAEVREVLTRMNGITVRDAHAKRLLEHAGVQAPIEVTADPALMLRDEPFGEDLLRREGIDSATRRVGLSVRAPGGAASNLDEEGYHALLAHAADFIVHRFDAEVVFVPLEREDIRDAHAVMGHMIAAERGHVLTGRYSPGQLLGLMRHLDFVVGMRLHVLVLAALAGVPFLALPYASKVEAFVESLGLQAPAELHRESAGLMLAALDELWDHRDEQRALLRARVPVLRERAERTTRMALDLLGGRAPAAAEAG